MYNCMDKHVEEISLYIDNDLNIHGMVCVYVYPHATCNNDESIHDTCYVL